MEVKSSDFPKRVAAIKAHPGVTFFKVIQAFNKIPSLSDHGTDMLRLYAEICDGLGLPPLLDMLHKLRDLIEAILEFQYTAPALGRSFLEAALTLTQKRLTTRTSSLTTSYISTRWGPCIMTVRIS